MKEIGRLEIPEDSMTEIISVILKCIEKRKSYEEYYPRYAKFPEFTGGELLEEEDTNAPSGSRTIRFKSGGLLLEFTEFFAQGDSGACIRVYQN